MTYVAAKRRLAEVHWRWLAVALAPVLLVAVAYSVTILRSHGDNAVEFTGAGGSGASIPTFQLSLASWGDVAESDLSGLVRGIGGASNTWFVRESDAVPSGAVIILDTAAVDSPSDFIGIKVYSADGSLIGAIATGGVPVVTVVGTELLVSDEPFEGSDSFDMYSGAKGRLTAYDLNNRLAPKWQTDLPGRAGYTSYFSRFAAVSSDGRHFAYLTQRWDPREACVDSRDGEACTIFGVGVLTLSSTIEVVGEEELPRGCGAASLDPAREGFFASCPDIGVVYAVRAEDVSLREVSVGGALPAETRSDRPPGSATIVGAFEDRSGRLAILFSTGTLRLLNDGSIEREIEVLPPGAYVVAAGGQFEVVDGRLLVPYHSPPNGPPAGAALIDLSEGSVLWRAESQGSVHGIASGIEARLLQGQGVAVVGAAGSDPLARFPEADSTWVVVR